jgi:hypothetical protein
MNEIESQSLAAHVSLCELRYKALEDRLENLETKLDALSVKISSIQESFIRTIIGTAGTIIVAIIGAAVSMHIN